MALAIASTLLFALSSSFSPTAARVRSASARAISSAWRRIAASTGSAARVSRSRVKAVTSDSMMPSARMASSARDCRVSWTTFWRSSMS